MTAVADFSKAAASALSKDQIAKVKALRVKGWAIPGLARRFNVTPMEIARVLGETWGKA